MKKDLVFVFFGGNMSGLFGAGVVSQLQKFDLYDRIDSIYAVSAGAHNAAYFLAQDTELGSSIYYEDLVNDKFIKKNKLKFLSGLFLRLFNKNHQLETFVDIDYLIDVEKNKKVLNTKKIYKSNINFFIRCFNLQTKKEEYLNGKNDIFKKLQATSAVMPFYSKIVKIDGKNYIDGGILSLTIDPILENIINENKGKKIFLIFNTPIRSKFSIQSLVASFLWMIFLLVYFREKFVFNKFKYIAIESKKLNKYRQYSNISIIEPDYNFSLFCKDKKKLLQLYSDAMEKTKDVLLENKIISA